MSQNETVSLEQLYEGGLTTFGNARSLYEEAIILRERGKIQRAQFLHLISLEECAKFEMIGHLATSVSSGQEYDLKKFQKNIRSHEFKNHVNAYDFPAANEELEARVVGDWAKALAEFKKLKSRYHKDRNDKKNNSLYVNFEGGKFTGPSDHVDVSSLQELHDQNEYYLEQIPLRLKVLKRMVDMPEFYSAVMPEFMSYMIENHEEVLEQPDAVVLKLKELYESHKNM